MLFCRLQPVQQVYQMPLASSQAGISVIALINGQYYIGKDNAIGQRYRGLALRIFVTKEGGMKVIKLTTILILFFCSPVLSNDKKPDESLVSVLSIKREIFYFKVTKALLGGTVEVYDTHGAIVLTEKVIKRKMIVDFFHREPGTYTIKIVKGDYIEVFECSFNLR